MIEKNPPEILYKYRDWNNAYHKKVLTENELYFASPREFNDPFDCAIPFRYDEKELTEENIFLKSVELAKRQNPEWDDKKIHELAYEHQRRKLIFDEHHVEEQNRLRQEHFNRDFTVLSLTEKKDNFLMWSHYSQSHSGFCVGYNTKLLFDQARGQLGPVLYSEEFPTFGLFDDAIKHFIKYVFYKSHIWEYEAEYRLLREAKKGKILKLTDDTMVEVVFGYKMKQPDKFSILKILENKYPHARVYDSKMHEKKFEIILSQIR